MFSHGFELTLNIFLLWLEKSASKMPSDSQRISELETLICRSRPELLIFCLELFCVTKLLPHKLSHWHFIWKSVSKSLLFFIVVDVNHFRRACVCLGEVTHWNSKPADLLGGGASQSYSHLMRPSLRKTFNSTHGCPLGPRGLPLVSYFIFIHSCSQALFNVIIWIFF